MALHAHALLKHRSPTTTIPVYTVLIIDALSYRPTSSFKTSFLTRNTIFNSYTGNYINTGGVCEARQAVANLMARPSDAKTICVCCENEMNEIE